MIASWMLFTLALSALAGLAALGLEQLHQREERSTRWIWLGAILLPPALMFIGAAPEASVPAFPLPAPGAPLDLVITRGPMTASAPLERFLAAVWLLSVVGLLVWLLISTAALRRARRSWRPGRIAGERVLLTSETGPAVAGFLDPVIILPAWVLALDEPAQRMIVAHEREHVRARDPWLVGLALGVLLLMPWNAVLWWQMRRLRIAVEVDCDARVVSDKVSARQYGLLLLGVAAMPGSRPSPAATFAMSRTALARRVRLLSHPRRPGYLSLLALFGLMIAGGAAVAAVPAPHVPEISYLGRIAFGADAPGAEDGPPFRALPGDPGPELVGEAVRRYHPNLAAGEARVVWFLADSDHNVLHTGTETGSAKEVAARILARHPGRRTDLLFHLSYRMPDSGIRQVVWIRPPVAPAP